jgi:hypothetical protein
VALFSSEVPPGKIDTMFSVIAMFSVIDAERVQLAVAPRAGDGWTVNLVAQYAPGDAATLRDHVTMITPCCSSRANGSPRPT